MKDLTLFRKSVLGVFVLFLGAVSFSSCLKDDGDNTQTPVAGLMAFNLAPDASAIGFTLSGNNLTSTPLAYTNYTGGYIGIYTGARSITAFDASSGNALANSDYTFDQDKYYSLFLVGDTAYQNVVVKDNIDTLPGTAGIAYVRYINAITGAVTPTIKISQNGNDVVTDNAAFGSVSEFAALAPGQITINVNSGDTVQADRSISIEERKVYTALLIGKPGVSDTAQIVKIKYIENGTLSPDSTTNGFGRVNGRTVAIN
jgi:hypothetical protein